jgi:hypothetical protein
VKYALTSACTTQQHLLRYSVRKSEKKQRTCQLPVRHFTGSAHRWNMRREAKWNNAPSDFVCITLVAELAALRFRLTSGIRAKRVTNDKLVYMQRSLLKLYYYTENFLLKYWRRYTKTNQCLYLLTEFLYGTSVQHGYKKQIIQKWTFATSASIGMRH